MAIALVLWLHSMVVLLPQHQWHLFGAGLGVDIFFVLSGFLITTLLVERASDGPGRMRRFYRRRAARLLPALLAFLAVHVAVAFVVDWSMRRELVTVLAAVTFTSNWVPSFGGDVAVATLPLWSLAVEEQFYLLWPAALALVTRLDPRRGLWLLGVAIGLVAAWRAVLTVMHGVGYPVVYQRTDARLDALLVGALLALALWRGWAPSRAASNRIGVAGALVVAVWVVNPVPFPDALFFGGYTLVALGTAGAILALVRGGDTLAARALSWRPLVALGRVSYSLYLWHYLVFVLVAMLLPASSLVRLALAYAAALCCATASYLGIEQPVLRWASAGPARRAEPALVASGPPPRPRSLRRAGAVVAATGAVLLGSGVGLAAAARQASDDQTREVVAPEGAGGAPVEEPTPAVDTTVEQAPAVTPPDGPGRLVAPAGPPGAGASAPPALDTGPASSLWSTVVEVLDPTDELLDVAGEAAAVEVAASLQRSDGMPLGGHALHFVVTVAGEELRCEASTDVAGLARCTVDLTEDALGSSAPLRVRATFGGAPELAPSEGEWTGTPRAIAPASGAAMPGPLG